MEFSNSVKKINWKSKNTLLETYDDIDEILPRNKYMEISNCHMGQRKLLLTEIMYYKDLPKNATVIYSGSAPGIHTDNILELFPYLNFIFIDPNYHNMKYDYEYIYINSKAISAVNKRNSLKFLRNTYTFCNGNTYDVYNCGQQGKLADFKEFKKRVYVIQDYMTPELGGKLSQMFDTIYHVSDIRTNMFDKHVTDGDIIHNSALQILINKELKPKSAFIKFVTPPYANRRDLFIEKIKNHEYINKLVDMDFIGKFKKGLFPFYGGDIFIQAWSPTTSTESRMLVNDFSKFIDYDILEFRGKMTYVSIYRNSVYIPKYYEQVKHLNLGYDGCNDCAIEIKLLSSLGNIKYLSEKISSVIGYNLINNYKCKNHGKLTKYKGVHFNYDVDYVEYKVDID
jgi:hypothetical protein